MKQAILLFVLCACLTVTASAQTLAEKLDALVSTASILRTSEVGICVYDLTAGIPIYRYQADKLYRPASIEKIVTAVTALSELGKDYPYQTRLSYSGTIAEGRLKGDVYVVGGFDPEFMESDLELLADTLYGSGIRQIDGRLVGDVSMTDSVYWGKGWSWDDTPEAFQPYLSPLMLNRGCVDITIVPGAQGTAGEVKISPASDYYQTDNRTLSRTPAAGRLRITRNWLENGNRILLTGNVASQQSTTINIYDSKAFFMETLRYLLTQKGIETADSVDYASAPAEALTVYTRKRPLEEVLHRALKESDNLAAESMFYHLGMRCGHKTSGTGSKDGQKAVYRFMKDSLGLSPADYKIVDGSGVSLYNYVSPDLIMAYLKYAYQNPHIYRPLYEALPIAGIDGTLKYRMRKGKAFRHVRAKTGTVTGICSLAGYASSVSGRQYAFVIINQNVLKARQARDFQDKVCEILVTE